MRLREAEFAFISCPKHDLREMAEIVAGSKSFAVPKEIANVGKITAVAARLPVGNDG